MAAVPNRRRALVAVLAVVFVALVGSGVTQSAAGLARTDADYGATDPGHVR